jgi:hypothetical protein
MYHQSCITHRSISITNSNPRNHPHSRRPAHQSQAVPLRTTGRNIGNVEHQGASLTSSPLQIAETPSVNILYEFTLFPQLPRELRNKIWEFAATEPRNIKLLLALIDADAGLHPRRTLIEGQHRHPGLLQACSESREEGLRVYQPCYHYSNYRVGFPHWQDSRSNITYINFALDQFELDLPGSRYDFETSRVIRSISEYNFKPPVLAKIKYLEVQCSSAGNNRNVLLITQLLHLLRAAEIKDLCIKFHDWVRMEREQTAIGQVDSEAREGTFRAVLQVVFASANANPELRFQWRRLEDTDRVPSDEWFGDVYNKTIHSR